MVDSTLAESAERDGFSSGFAFGLLLLGATSIRADSARLQCGVRRALDHWSQGAGFPAVRQDVEAGGELTVERVIARACGPRVADELLWRHCGAPLVVERPPLPLGAYLGEEEWDVLGPLQPRELAPEQWRDFVSEVIRLADATTSSDWAW